MKLLVGTLYTNENEFEECCRSINEQTYKNYDHFIIRNLPNKEAHIKLFKSFLENGDKYDVLIKVDADMVLVKETLFEGIVQKLIENKWADIYSIAVQDFFSDQLIWGLNAYRNTVRWNLTKESLFVDRPEVPVEKYLSDNNELAPAAIHCKNPSPFQAFHYGVHRGLKVIQRDRRVKLEQSSKTHWNSLERTWLNFQKTKDTRMGLACLGAEMAYLGQFRTSDLDYSNPRFKKILTQYVHMDFKRLNFELQIRRFLNWGLLPARKRREIICLLKR